jgi:AcrR family transcriptional regulator
MSTPERQPESPSRNALQERVRAAILDAAAHVVAQGGGDGSMADVATAAGVARATVYRYFPSRGALLDALAAAALRDAGTRLRSARVDEVPLHVGVERAIRALVDVGDYLVVIARERVRPDPSNFEAAIATPLRRLLERGQASAEIRSDVPVSWLSDALVAIVLSAVSSAPPLGRDDTVTTVCALFMEGAGAPGRRKR